MGLLIQNAQLEIPLLLATFRELKIGLERNPVKTEVHSMGQLDIHTNAIIL